MDIDPQNYFCATITGSLVESEELDLFKINTPTTYNREQVIKLLRFNKRHFYDAGKHDELIKAFQRFSAKAYVDMMQDSDTRGNKEANFKKTVDTQLPADFILHIPIYKGQPKETFRAEIALDVTDGGAKFWFESPELVELLQMRKEAILATQLKACEGFVIINQ